MPVELAHVSQDMLEQSEIHATSFVLVQGNLGVFYKPLLHLFLQACQLLPNIRLPEDSASAVTVTSIILLANPAHNTALTLRKRLVLAEFVSPTQDLRFMSLILPCSKETCKQSILWAHRAWLLAEVHGTLPNQIHMSSAAFAGEVSLALVCCATYPRNYSAWNHLQACFLSFAHNLHPGDVDGQNIFTEQLDRLRCWIDTHVSDHTACHHYSTLVRRLDVLGEPPQGLENHTPTSVIAHASSLIRLFPKHESLWMYLRAGLQMLSPDAHAQAVLSIREEFGRNSCEHSLRLLAWLDSLVCMSF